jgi:hypothetical protein
MLADETVRYGAREVCGNCGRRAVPGIMRSAAGYYYGHECFCGPYSRESEYYSSEAELKKAIRDGNVRWRR